MRVVFDIGHGANTVGKGVGNFREHDFNSSVAIKAKALAEQRGFEILFTQEPQSNDIHINTRANWVNEQHKTKPILCLLSFHANASSSKDATGWTVFHWHNSANGKRLADLWAKHVAPLKPWGKGIWESKTGMWTNFVMVRVPVMPCLLIEHFFFTNPNDLAKYNTPEMINFYAEVAVKVICEYAGVDYNMGIPIMGKSELKVEQMRKFLREISPNAPEIEQLFLDEGDIEGVRGDLAFCQSIHETDYFRFTGTAKIEWHNPAGLGVTGPAGVGNRFPDWQIGVRAQIQHLKAYATDDTLNKPCVDQRFHLVSRGSAPTWTDLNGKWAYPGTTYGQAILKLFDKVKAIKIDTESEKVKLLTKEIESLNNENERLQELLNDIEDILHKR